MHTRFFRKHYWITYTLLFCVIGLGVYYVFWLEDKSLIRESDGLEQQYMNYVYIGKWLRQIARSFLQTGHIQIPAWDTSLGYGADYLLANEPFLGDPLYYLSVLIPTQYAEVVFSFNVVLRSFLSGVTFSLFSRSHGNGRFGTLVGALSYAFSGWMLLGFEESMFIMPAVYFPLILMGVDRVLEGKSPLLLSITTAALFIVNFYFGYTACFLVPVYTVVKVVLSRSGEEGARRTPPISKQAVVQILKVALAFAGGVLMAGFALVPLAHVMLGQGRLALQRDTSLLYPLTYYERLISGFIGHANVGADSYIGCGALVLPCVVLLLKRRDAKVASLRVFFVLLSALFLLPIAGRILNGMAYATNRWAFAYALCMSMILAKMHGELRDATREELGLLLKSYAVVGICCFVFPACRTTETFACLLVSACFTLTQVTVCKGTYLHTKAPCAAYVITLGCLACSLVIPAYFASYNLVKREVDAGEAFNTVMRFPGYRLLDQIDDKDLYRYDYAGVSRMANSDSVANRNSFDLYTSIYNKNIESFESSLLLAQDIRPQYVSGPSGSAGLYDFLGTRYFVAPCDNTSCLPFGFDQAPVATTEEGGRKIGIYKNKEALPFAFGVERAVSTGYYDALSEIERRQLLLQAVAVEDAQAGSGYDWVEFADVEPAFTVNTKGDISLTDSCITVNKAGAQLKFEFDGKPNAETYFEVRSMKYSDFPLPPPADASIRSGIKWLEAFAKHGENKVANMTLACDHGLERKIGVASYKDHMYGGKDSSLNCVGYSSQPVSTLTVTFDTPGTYTYDDMRVLQLPINATQSHVRKLAEDDIKVREGVNSYSISANMKADKYLLLTVPWSEGWSVVVDGEDGELCKADMAFMAVKLSAGRHEVVFRYRTPHLEAGIGISVVGLALTGGLSLLAKRRTVKSA